MATASSISRVLNNQFGRDYKVLVSKGDTYVVSQGGADLTRAGRYLKSRGCQVFQYPQSLLIRGDIVFTKEQAAKRRTSPL